MTHVVLGLTSLTLRFSRRNEDVCHDSGEALELSWVRGVGVSLIMSNVSHRLSKLVSDFDGARRVRRVTSDNCSKLGE